MEQQIRWGILGLGRIAGVFAEGLKHVPGSTLVACGSRGPQKAEEFGAKWSVPRRHASYAALAADPEVDAIYIATPHPLHRENCLLCLEHGKAVLCEKPFAVNAAEAAEVLAAARRHNLLLMEAMWSRFLPHLVQVRDLIAGGAIGEPRLLQADFAFRAGWNPDGRLLNPQLAGGGLLDVGVYNVNLAHMVFGVPQRVMGTAHLGETGVDEQAGMLLQFAAGRLAVLSCGVRTSTPQEAFIAGTEGRIRIHTPWWRPSRLTVSIPGKGDTEYAPAIVGNGYNYEALEFGRCLRAGLTESPVMPWAESLAVMQTLDALRAQFGLSYPMERRAA